MVLGQRNPTQRISHETVAGAPAPDNGDSLPLSGFQDAMQWASDECILDPPITRRDHGAAITGRISS
jgi:hypothetical protein